MVASLFFSTTPANSNVALYESSENFNFTELARIVTGDGELGAEIPTFHWQSKQLFATNAVRNTVDIYSLSDPANPTLVNRVSMEPYGDGMTSVAAGNDVIAVGVTRDAEYDEDGSPIPQDGVLVVMKPSGQIVSSVNLNGVGPDAVTFTPDGRTALVAIEGEPICALDNPDTAIDESENYRFAADPEGMVAIVNLNRPSKPRVRNINFDYLRFDIETRDIALNAVVNNPALDLEPEYVAAIDNRYAYVTLQEANGVAKVDIHSKRVVDVYSAGYTDRGEVAFDPSDRDGGLGMRTYASVYGTRQPDTIAAFKIGRDDYFVTANEGDAREWSCLTDDVRAKDLDGNLSVFPNWSDLNDDDELGRMKVDPNLGDDDGDGLYEAFYARGGRSMSIYENGELIYDSGSLIETVQTSLFGTSLINGQHEEDGGVVEYAPQSRSDDKGAEPEGLAVGMVGRSRVAILGLERMSALLLFDITNPYDVVFEQWTQMQPLENTLLEDSTAWSPEGIIFIPAKQSPNRKALVITSYELSGSLSIHQITRS